MPGYIPLRLLNTQFERGITYQNIPLVEKGELEPLFIDSGAYSVWTGKGKENIEEYVTYLNSINKYIEFAAQFDTIPGKSNQPKVPQDYIDSAKKSWEQFEWQYYHMDSPEKLIYVYHQGEPMTALKKALEWKDNQGRQLQVVGLSGQGDTSNQMQYKFFVDCMRVIQASSHPKVKTHLFGVAIEKLLRDVSPYCSDSTTHVQLSAYGKIWVPGLGDTIVSARQVGEGGTVPYVDADEIHQRISDYLKTMNLTFEQVQDNSYYRMATYVYRYQRLFNDINIPGLNTVPVKVKSLFKM
jgi:hypothetical protein